MLKEKREKLINICLFLLVVLIAQEVVLLTFDRKDSLTQQLQKKWVYSKTIKRGMGFYSAAKISKLEIDEYFLLSEINRHEKKFPLLSPRDKFAKDPFKRIFDKSNPIPDVRFERKDISKIANQSINNSFYRLNNSQEAFLVDPTDDVLFRALYCDQSGYDNYDFSVLKSINPKDGGYFETHFLISLLFLKENKCYENDKIDAQIEMAVKDIFKAEENDQYFSDLYVERIVVLYWSGYGNLVKKEWTDIIKNNLTSDPGWRDRGLFVSDAHTTGLALLSLIYYREGENKQPFYR